MFDWKIIVTLLVVLAVLATFIGSTPEVSGFFREVGDRLSGIVSSTGIDLGSTGENQFSLSLKNFDSIKFNAVKSSVSITGDAEALVDKGTIKVTNPSVSGFTGSGYISSALVLNGSADALTFGSSRLEKIALDMSSYPSEFRASNVSVSAIVQDNAQGELVLNSTVTKFSGRLEIKSFRGDIFLNNSSLEIDGKAKTISLPGAGIRIG